MRHKYIAIEREYGSGGTEIARRAAVACNVPCYGREILEIVSNERQVPVERIEKYEETVTNSFLYSMYLLRQTGTAGMDMLSEDGHIYVAEQEVIQRLAAEGPAIFLGHCAAEALREREDVLRVFICSDKGDKIRRIVDDYAIPPDRAESTMKRFDKKRANYYYANTMRKWNDEKNYDLVLNSGRLGSDNCVSVLKCLLSK